MKQQIKSIIRGLGLSKLADDIRYRYVYYKNKKKNDAFLKDHPQEQFPSPYMIYETFRLDYKIYYDDGLETAEWIKNEVKPYLNPSTKAILDWGCGPGRVIRHLPKVFGSYYKIYGTDYNQRYVDWCEQNLTGITFKKNGLYPPLLFDDDSMDLVYGISIFTHLSEDAHYKWIDELCRVTHSGGIILLTTHGNVTKQNLLPEEAAMFDAGQLVVRGSKEGHRVFTAYHPDTFMHQLFEGKLQILKHTRGIILNNRPQQDVWILKKI